MFSAKIENARFLRAIALPVDSQKASSSGSQWSIQRPRRWPPAALVRRSCAPPACVVRLMVGTLRARKQGLYDIRSDTAAPIAAARSKANRAVREHDVSVPRPRARIDHAALADAFAPDGLHGTSSSALAAAVGVAKPTLYVHGRSKHDLFLLAVEAEVERVLGGLEVADRGSAGRSARDRAAAAAHALLDHAAARPAGARLLARTARHATSPVAVAVAQALTRIPDRIAAGLRRDLAADGLDPALAPFLARAVHGAACALAEVREGERRPARPVLAALAASVVPEPPRPAADDWPAA